MAQKIDGRLLINPEAESAIDELKTLLENKETVQFDTIFGAVVLLARGIIELESKIGGLDGK